MIQIINPPPEHIKILHVKQAKKMQKQLW